MIRLFSFSDWKRNTGNNAGLSDIKGMSITSNLESPIVFLKLEKSSGSAKDDLLLLEEMADRVSSLFLYKTESRHCTCFLTWLDTCRLWRKTHCWLWVRKDRFLINAGYLWESNSLSQPDIQNPIFLKHRSLWRDLLQSFYSSPETPELIQRKPLFFKTTKGTLLNTCVWDHRQLIRRLKRLYMFIAASLLSVMGLWSTDEGEILKTMASSSSSYSHFQMFSFDHIWVFSSSFVLFNLFYYLFSLDSLVLLSKFF